MESSGNLFVRLHKWAYRQDENFLTEAFAYVLKHLIEYEPEAAVHLVESLTGGLIRLKPEQTKLLRIESQAVSDEGIPDLMLRTAHQLVIVEVKSASEPRPEQLVRYRRLLKESGLAETALVLLTRYPVNLEEGTERPEVRVRWFQVAEWLNLEQQRYTFQAVSKYLVEQFVGFLRTRNMVMGEVTWELPGGVRALRALADMLYEAATACGVRARIWGNRGCMGVYLEGQLYWVGVDFDRPEILTFETWNAAVDRESAERLGAGKIYEWTNEPGFGWRRELNLETEEVHFFARSKASQLQLLENFLRECLDQVRTVVIATKDRTDSEHEDEPEAP